MVSVGFNDANLFQYRLGLKGRTWVFSVYCFTLSKLAMSLRGEITLCRMKRKDLWRGHFSLRADDAVQQI